MAMNMTDPFFLTVLAGTVIAVIAMVVLTTSVWDVIQQLNHDVWGEE